MQPNLFMLPSWKAIYQIVGFDRLHFVNDVAQAIPQDGHCRIAGLTFEADGVRVTGRLIVQTDDRQLFTQIDRQLRVIQGLVSVIKTN